MPKFEIVTFNETCQILSFSFVSSDLLHTERSARTCAVLCRYYLHHFLRLLAKYVKLPVCFLQSARNSLLIRFVLQTVVVMLERSQHKECQTEMEGSNSHVRMFSSMQFNLVQFSAYCALPSPRIKNLNILKHCHK